MRFQFLLGSSDLISSLSSYIVWLRAQLTKERGQNACLLLCMTRSLKIIVFGLVILSFSRSQTQLYLVFHVLKRQHIHQEETYLQAFYPLQFFFTPFYGNATFEEQFQVVRNVYMTCPSLSNSLTEGNSQAKNLVTFR